MKKHCILLFFYCLNILMNTVGAYNLKQVADKEYMSNSAITSLCQDDKGLMWIGTCDGLNVYDGRVVKEFKTRDKEDYLSGNQIDNIVYTGDDTYWFQTYYSLIRLDCFRWIRIIMAPYLLLRIATVFIIFIKKKGSLKKSMLPVFRFRML